MTPKQIAIILLLFGCFISIFGALILLAEASLVGYDGSILGKLIKEIDNG